MLSSYFSYRTICIVVFGFGADGAASGGKWANGISNWLRTIVRKWVGLLPEPIVPLDFSLFLFYLIF